MEALIKALADASRRQAKAHDVLETAKTAFEAAHKERRDAEEALYAEIGRRVKES